MVILSLNRNFSFQTKLISHFRKHKSDYVFVFCVAICALASKITSISCYIAASASVCLYLSADGFEWLRLFRKIFGRDIRFLKVVLRIELSIRIWIASNTCVVDLFKANARKFPYKIAFSCVESGNKLTFGEADEMINKIGNVFYEAGYRKGDVVALLMENRAEYLPIWLGLSQIGVVTALINYNLHGDSLTHCITVSECKAVIYSQDLEVGIKEIAAQLNVQFYNLALDKGSIENAKSLEMLMQSASRLAPPRPIDLTLDDKMLYIYTSGTTGLPKAALVRGTRFMFMCVGIGLSTSITEQDVIYNSLPLYHSNGGIVLAGQSIFNGTTLVVRKKFSASKCFEDCCKNNVTVFNYIGETCRYLLAQPRREFDKSHHIRVAIGNGLRASMWSEFKDRFNIELIAEFYGATEGNANMINNVGRVGAVGYNSVIVPWVYPIKLIKIDEDTGIATILHVLILLV